MEISLLQPPFAFIILLAASGLLLAGLRRFSSGRQRLTEPYACGEELASHLIQPDYGQFLPFAFFFTILHVIALMAATVPVTTLGSSAIAVIYLGCALLWVYRLYAR
jgi:NADH-quinone oxidoreductase subunit A